MKAKHIVLIVVISIPCALAYSCYRLVRFPGDRGEVYDTWETANETFKVRMKAYYEVGIYMPGAFYTCESAPAGSNEWREFKAFRGDDAIPLSRLNQRFRFVNAQSAYFYTADDFLVTLDSGRNWSFWRPPTLTQPDGTRVYWAIMEAHVNEDGTGKAKLWNYDERIKAGVSMEASTKDYGQNWDVVQSTAKHNNGMHPTPLHGVSHVR
jgi:hypothetical protein